MGHQRRPHRRCPQGHMVRPRGRPRRRCARLPQRQRVGDPWEWLREHGYGNASNGRTNSQHKIVASYDYTDEFGTLLFQVVRLAPKTFRQRRPDGNGGWLWNLRGRHPRSLPPARLDGSSRARTARVRRRGREGCSRRWRALASSQPAILAAPASGGMPTPISSSAPMSLCCPTTTRPAAIMPTRSPARLSARPRASACSFCLVSPTRATQATGSAPGALSRPSTRWSTGHPIGPTTARASDELPQHNGRILRGTEFADLSTISRKVWLVHHLLAIGEISVWYGEPGSGKSVAVEDIALHIAAGRCNWHGRQVMQGAVLYVALERFAVVARRAIAWGLEHGLSREQFPFKAIRGPLDFRDPQAAADIVATLEDVAQRHGCKAGLLIVDTVSRALCGGDENSPKDMGGLIANIGRIQSAIGVHIALTHHQPVDGKERMRGHGALLGAVDTTVHVVNKDGTRLAEVVKLERPRGRPARRLHAQVRHHRSGRRLWRPGHRAGHGRGAGAGDRQGGKASGESSQERHARPECPARCRCRLRTAHGQCSHSRRCAGRHPRSMARLRLAPRPGRRRRRSVGARPLPAQPSASPEAGSLASGSPMHGPSKGEQPGTKRTGSKDPCLRLSPPDGQAICLVCRFCLPVRRAGRRRQPKEGLSNDHPDTRRQCETASFKSAQRSMTC